MSLTQQPPDNKPSETKPLSPDQEEQKALREQQQKVVRRFHFEALQGRKLFKYRRSDGTSVEEENPGEGLAQVGTEIPLPKQLTEGWYDLYENVGDKEVDPKYKTTVFVNKEGTISFPSPPFDPHQTQSMEKFHRDCTQVFRAYTAGLGVNRLSLDYPNCYKNGQPDPAKYMLIDLNKVMRMLTIAEKEGAAIRISQDSALAARLANPKNKKDERMCKKILDQAKKTETALDSKVELNRRQAEMSQVFHADNLKTETAALKTKSEELAKASEADMPAKLKELAEAKTKVDSRLTKIETEFDAYHPSADVCKKYDGALSTASKTIREVNNRLSDNQLANKVPDKNKPELQALQKGMGELQTKTDKLGKKAGINAMLPPERSKEKITALKAKMDGVEKSAAAYKTLLEKKDPEASGEELKKAKEELKKALKETASSVRDINSEAKKTEKEPALLKQYQTAIQEAKDKMDKIDTMLPADLKGEAAEERAALGATIAYTANNLNEVINPTVALENKLKNEVDQLQDPDMVVDDKLEVLTDNVNFVKDRLTEIEQKAKELEEELKQCETMDSKDDIEKVIKSVEDKINKLEEDVEVLQKHQEALKGSQGGMAEEAKKFGVEKQLADINTKLNGINFEPSRTYMQGIQDKAQGFLSSAPTPRSTPTR